MICLCLQPNPTQTQPLQVRVQTQVRIKKFLSGLVHWMIRKTEKKEGFKASNCPRTAACKLFLSSLDTDVDDMSLDINSIRDDMSVSETSKKTAQSVASSTPRRHNVSPVTTPQASLDCVKRLFNKYAQLKESTSGKGSTFRL